MHAAIVADRGKGRHFTYLLGQRPSIARHTHELLPCQHIPHAILDGCHCIGGEASVPRRVVGGGGAPQRIEAGIAQLLQQ